MFIVRWKGEPPDDKEDWINVLRDVVTGAGGSYRIWFYPGPHGWKFDFEWRQGRGGSDDDDMLSNSPETLRFNVYQSLLERGKPMDPDWRTP
jgi:hypothetical protein